MKATPTFFQRPDHYTYQVSVYLPSISILIIILSILIFKYWYWYFLFQKRTEILILQYCFSHQYQYFSIYFSRTCNYNYANIGFIWDLDCVSHKKNSYFYANVYSLKFTLIIHICLVYLFFHTFFQKGYWYWILILQFFWHTDTDT